MDCNKCVRRGQINGLSQESYCDACIHGQKWKKDYYSEGPVGGIAHKNCDGCARWLVVINGHHLDEYKKYVCACTAYLYT